MAWPNDNLADTDVDSATDRPPRAMFRSLLLAVKSVIGSRGAASGIASLDAAGKVPAIQINGLAMTAAERAKLAGVEAGATADQTASEMRAAIGIAGTGLITGAERAKLAGVATGATRITGIATTRSVSGSGDVVGDVSIGTRLVGTVLYVDLAITRREDQRGGGSPPSQATQNTQNTQATQGGQYP